MLVSRISHPAQATKLSRAHRQAPASVLVGIRPIRKRTKSGSLYGYKDYLCKRGDNARLGIVNYNPLARKIRRDIWSNAVTTDAVSA